MVRVLINVPISGLAPRSEDPLYGHPYPPAPGPPPDLKGLWGATKREPSWHSINCGESQLRRCREQQLTEQEPMNRNEDTVSQRDERPSRATNSRRTSGRITSTASSAI